MPIRKLEKDKAALSAVKSVKRLAEVPRLSRQVHAQLERLIVTRALPPGTRLVESELAETLGVSRAPIRVALQELALDRFIEIRPRLGAFVRVPSYKEVNDFFEIRRALEGESARLAAMRITPRGAEQLRSCIERGRELLANNKDPTSKPPFLHQIIATIADNEQLTEYLVIHGKRAAWYRLPFEANSRRESWEEHSRIADAIVRGDPDEALRAMHDHIDSARALYVQMNSAKTPRD